MPVVRTSYLRRRAAGGPDLRRRATNRTGEGASFGRFVRRVLKGHAAEPGAAGELDDLEMPNILDIDPGTSPDSGSLLNLLELAFLGRAGAGEIDRALDAMPAPPSDWHSEHFSADLFVDDLVDDCLPIAVAGHPVPAHRRFLGRVLAAPPVTVEGVGFRQAVLAEIEGDPAVESAVEQLLVRLSGLLTMLKVSRDDARLEPVKFRLDVLRSFRAVIDEMADGFSAAESGLSRLHEFAVQVRGSRAFGRMTAMLDHESAMADLRVRVVLGADGRLRRLSIDGIEEARKNPFHRGPLRRLVDRVRRVSRSYRLRAAEIADRLVMDVYQEIAPAMVRSVQAVGHLEIYLAARGFARLAEDRGLEVSLPELDTDQAIRLEGLFNPLLLKVVEHPVPTDVAATVEAPLTLVTGPNSGGKTRLLQALGLAQVLGQSGLYAPCSAGRLPIVSSLFASIVEVDRADQAEGRLGTEIVRLRALFETVPPDSLVLLDELCSGTNPSEAIEIVTMVLKLLRQLGPLSFVTTHFLDFAREQRQQPSVDGLGFLQAETDEGSGPTYRFVRGVAATSLAVGTARRLGVTFEELENGLRDRRRD